ncbi:hypothetical protein C8J57DRAFT_1527411 [Mycena rebaudengoi]|nr:hypothetical protein C8J57DRAFT_1527411 [Mycena rebaudengoi]
MPPATRSSTASPASHTRSHGVIASPFATPTSGLSADSSAPTARSIARRKTMEARHARDFPITVGLGIFGTMAQKYKEVQDRLREEFELYSPLPPPAQHLPRNHQGHNLGLPAINTGKKGRGYGAYVQPCVWCLVPDCNAVFQISAPLPNKILALPPIADLLHARAELKPKFPPPPVLLPAYYAARSTTPTPSASPELQNLASADETEDQTSGSRASSSLLLGNVVHYSSDGHILCQSSSPPIQDQASDQENYDDETSSSVEEPRYPDIVFDLSLPVKVFAWFKEDSAPIKFTVYPHMHQPGNNLFSRAELVLADFKEGFEAEGFPTLHVIQHHLDSLDSWVWMSWSASIPIYSHYKIVHIRVPGITVNLLDDLEDLLLNSLF